MLKSTIARSGGVCSAIVSAGAPSSAVNTWNPARDIAVAMTRRTRGSSSTIRMRTPDGALAAAASRPGSEINAVATTLTRATFMPLTGV
jgi:hypothetical protein